MPKVTQLDNGWMMESQSPDLELHAYAIVDIIINSFKQHTVWSSVSMAPFGPVPEIMEGLS